MNKISTRKALNPAYRKHKPLRKDITSFVEHLKVCIDAIKISDERGEHEEHLKEPIKNFLQKTFYSEYLINTKDRIDLAIYLDKTAKSDVGVIIEAKRPSNKAEFITPENLNKKALQELLLYYLRERLDGNNNNIKHLIITNGFEWFFFKAEDFYNYFYKNKALIKEYESFRDGLKDTTKNELFYSEIAKKYIEIVKDSLPFVYINFSNINIDNLDDGKLNTYFKIFSNVHLLGQSFGNDTNQLNKTFYDELLHIIGLEEIPDGGKKVIRRKSKEKSDYASLLETTIFTLEERAYLDKVKSVENTPEKAFNVGLELCLTWINRILFLKLLESQLASFNKGAKEYKFLNTEFIDGFDELNNLFFSALAKKIDDRHPRFAEKFKNIPYLNSSLFERSDLESETFEITALIDDEMAVFHSTILKDVNGKKLKGKLKTLDYLFRFLDAYDFATDGTEGIVDSQEHKTLINASVLGLIFEKINGYKDGSFYTPAYITMYMCRDTIRRSVVQKFKDKENDSIESFDDVIAYCHKFFKADDIFRFNNLINSLRICDPAVGSGHFLVSALNELISIKNDLGILVDTKGNHLKVDVQIENDELYISDSTGQLFEYNPNDKESTRIQKTLFEEKQTLIENCLFGVDINPNSVKICRLRLWIELLKNAYYTDKKQLHTLPNIDINIKCGNSLISRFDLRDDLKNSFKNKETKYSFIDYKNAVAEYKNTNSKEKKQQVLEIIDEVKNNIKSVFYTTLKENKDLANYRGQLINLQTANIDLFGAKLSKSKQEIEEKRLKLLIKQQEEKVSEVTNNAIYRNAFEWRFEFPEVLDDDGTYIGFDLIIGNPPYLRPRSIDESTKNAFKLYNVFENQFDLYHLFIEKAFNISNKSKNVSFIVPNTFLANENNKNLRKFILNKFNVDKIIDSRQKVFEDADVDVLIFIFGSSNNQYFELIRNEIVFKHNFDFQSFVNNKNYNFTITLNKFTQSILNKLIRNSNVVSSLFDVSSGIKEYQVGKGTPKQTNDDKLNRVFNSNYKVNESYRKELRGKNIGRYTINWNDEYIKYGKSLAEPRDAKYFEGKRILIRKIPANNYLVLSYTDENFVIDQSIYVGKPKDENIDILYCLGCLNSKITYWYFKNLYNEFDNLFPQIKTNEFKNLLIPKAEVEKQKLISDKVKLIIENKERNIEFDSSKIELQIDKMVYDLFGLTTEEINEIEKK